MEINRAITNVWTITVNEAEVFDRFIDETIQENNRRTARPSCTGITAPASRSCQPCLQGERGGSEAVSATPRTIPPR